MKILTGNQIREADEYTIGHEPVESIELMERASEAIAGAICGRVGQEEGELLFFIGKGNNGGDGLAVARIMADAGFSCSVYMVYPVEELSSECRLNYQRLPRSVRIVDNPQSDLAEHAVVIDAVLGTGVKGEVTGAAKSAIGLINSLGRGVFSIDIPSGMKTEFGNEHSETVVADLTLAIEFPKLAMLLPEAGERCGEIEIVDIGLDREYMARTPSGYGYITHCYASSFLKKREKFGHKGTYGHALLICGSGGMFGAAVLSTCAALRSGCGMVTVHLPEGGASAVYANAPSALVSSDRWDCFHTLPADCSKYDVIGIGCGMGQSEETAEAMRKLFKEYRRPMVIDADALNIISRHDDIRRLIPRDSVLTPHPGELKRLTGEWGGEEEKIRMVRQLSAELDSTVVLKGAHTMICLSDGLCLFNSTGAPGMAKGGSGDVLTGFITGLVARGYSPREAAVLGVHIHGKAGEKAADYFGNEAMNSQDMIDFLADAYNDLL